MRGHSVQSVLAVSMLLMVLIPVSTTTDSDGAPDMSRMTSDPPTCYEAVVDCTCAYMIYVYPEAYVRMTYVDADGYEVTSVSLQDDESYTGVGVEEDGRTVSGYAVRNVYITLTMSSSEGTVTNTATILVASINEVVYMTTYRSYDHTLTVLGEIRFATTTHSGGTLPDGVSLSSDGRLYGQPETAGRYYFTMSGPMANNPRGSSSASYLLIVEELSSTTSVDVTEVSMVEGETVTFRVDGGVEQDLAQYKATVSVTGGSTSMTELEGSSAVTYKAPQVSGETTFTITVRCSTEGVDESTATVTVTVVDRLVTSSPSAGVIRNYR